jgi:hypothetical protein
MVQADPATVVAGQPTDLSGQGFPAGSSLLVNMFSNPTLVGTTTADALGRFQVSVVIPATTPPGQHTLVVAPASGSPRAQTAILVLGAGTATSTTVSPALSVTGADTRTPALVAVVLLLAGTALVTLSWRRRSDIQSGFRRR